MTILKMLAVVSVVLTSTITVYDFDVTSVDGGTIHLSDFHGKKILFVNTASNSPYVDQYASLQQLHEQYKDSLVIIAVPSNSFGNETAGNSDIQEFVNTHYHITYLLAAKTGVAGPDISPLYAWLTQFSQNGAMDNPVDGDFTKYLVNEDGVLVGTFASGVDPLSNVLQDALHH